MSLSKTIAVCLAAFTLVGGAPAVTGRTAPPVSLAHPRIEWDAKSLVCVQAGATYGRMIRLRGRDEGKPGVVVCSYERGGKSWVKRSRDNGKTWGAATPVKTIEGANAANPELLQLRTGRLLLFYNQRPHDGAALPFAIGVCQSDDNGATWRAQEKPIYEAGRTPQIGCWEPAAIELPSGEIHLFFANEFPYPENDDQEITRLRSSDHGATWGKPETVAYRAGCRDGMPVPLLLPGARGAAPRLVIAIEDNGLIPGAKLQPALVSLSPTTQAFVGGDSARRWGAVTPPLPERVYAGAPHLRQLPTGETVLSCQSDENGRTTPQMTVYLGDRNARNFARPSAPFASAGKPADRNRGDFWNAVFVKNADTVTAVSDTSVNGVRGVWAIDGRSVRAQKK